MTTFRVYEDFECDVIYVAVSDGRLYSLTREFLVDLECPPHPKDLIPWLERFVKSFGRVPVDFHVVEIDGVFYPNEYLKVFTFE